jgi:hypothetical protein
MMCLRHDGLPKRRKDRHMTTRLPVEEHFRSIQLIQGERRRDAAQAMLVRAVRTPIRPRSEAPSQCLEPRLPLSPVPTGDRDGARICEPQGSASAPGVVVSRAVVSRAVVSR